MKFKTNMEYLHYEIDSPKYHNLLSGKIMYIIKCYNCQNDLFTYQKNDYSPLTKCKLNNILECLGNFELANILQCTKCNTIISQPIKENDGKKYYYLKL